MPGGPAAPFTSGREKESYVRSMFDRVAPRYDLLNRVLAAGLDARWRREAARAATQGNPGPYLDVGAGTGDLTLALAAAAPGEPVLGIDLARRMLEGARLKPGVAEAPIGLVHASGLRLPARDAGAGAITNAFVLRNLADLDVFFREAFRALRPGGRLVSLEISRPPGRVFGPLYGLYFFRVMPRLGRWISGDKEAYRYLAESVRRVETPERLAARMEAAGFKVAWRGLFRGAVVLFVAERPAPSAAAPKR